MSKTNIICVDDQREVLSAIKKDLESFSDNFNIVDCESAGEADEVIEDLLNDGESIALIICDHIMPGENGIDFLAKINNSEKLKNVKKLLLTGLATQQDTIKAVNEAQIDYYLEKPWDSTEFIEAVKKLV